MRVPRGRARHVACRLLRGRPRPPARALRAERTGPPPSLRRGPCPAGVRPKDIGILVVNCSLFNPTPSLAAMVINHFKMRSNIISYNLSGMGCSCSPIAIDLAQQMLQLHPSTYALVLSTENITQNWYFGNNK